MFFIISAMLTYAVAILFITIAARNADSNTVTAIANAVSAVVPIAAILPFFGRKSSAANTKLGLIMAVLGGLMIALYTLALTKSYTQNRVAIVTPIVYGGSIFLSAILSYVFLKERITPVQAVGLVLLAAGFGTIIYARSTGK